MNPGWFDDPTGRFSRRWYDGNDWTDQVLGANGNQMSDAIDGGASVAPSSVPPPQQQMAAAPMAGAGSYAQQAPWQGPGGGFPGQSSQPRSSGGGLLAAAAGLAGVGLLALLLSIFVFDWAEDTTYLDIQDKLGELGSNPNIEVAVSYYYLKPFVWIGLVAVLAGAAAAVFARNRALRIVTAAAASLFAMWHLFTVVWISHGGDLYLGGALGAIGYLLVIVGLMIGPGERTAR